MAPSTRKTQQDPHQIIIVRSGFNGLLTYTSPKTGEQFVWDEMGSYQEMELGELRTAKNAAKGFFENNWFMFDEEYKWVVEYLGVTQYYKNAVSLEDFDDIFTKPIDEIESIIKNMSYGQKQTLAYRARQKVVDGEIDSKKVIATLEKSLNISLDDK
jgi:hypothetical protein